MPLTILVTGSRGAIGRVVVDELRRRGHRVRGLDRGEQAHADDVRADLTDGEAMRAAARGAQAIVHLAATPDEADFVTLLVPNNVVGTYRVLEAARLEGVPRVVLASSTRAVEGSADRTEPRPAAAPPMPHDLYSWTKAGAELMGALYAREHGLSVLAVRIGMFARNAREWALVASWKDRRGYFSWRDTRQFFARAAEAAPTPGYTCLYASSRGAATLYDLDAARRAIGYEPVDTWPDGTPEVSGNA
jgi:dTDP-4-dehydrorhamnose reductase